MVSSIINQNSSSHMAIQQKESTTSQQDQAEKVDIKEKTKEANLIVCLYYNLACCY